MSDHNAKGLMPSLPEVNRSIRIADGGFWRRMASFLGPGYLVAVGYMDPGNWATSIAGGSAFGYTLLSIVVMSNFMAIILQALSLRLGIASGRDLAQACFDAYGRKVRWFLWLMAELAIIATDLAEVIGTAIALNLLFGMPMEIGVILTLADVFLIFWLQGKGFRKVEAVIVALTLVIAVCFIVQIIYADPVWGDLLAGIVPQRDILESPMMLYLALGIIGATVMPHNLYLHSAIIQTRNYGDSDAEKRDAIRLGTIDSTVALMFALFINGAILVLAAAAFHGTGRTEVAEIQEAYALLSPILGLGIASTLFAVALLASGLNSTVTATLAGQIIMEGFIQFRMPAWARRLVTRGIAVVPAVIAVFIFGDSGTARLLVLSQVVLSLQLPFAVVPLVIFTANRKLMKGLQAPRWMTVTAALIALVVIILNMKLLYDVATGAISI
ncbi:MAG: Nramp family divalent metal transporter [Rhodobacteraceae bacterium]|nr:Nramp family divalent metal transporter [Paracoccaceae bacterium]